MKINTTKKSSKKPLIITLCVAALLIGGYATYAFVNNTWPFTQQEETPAQDNQPITQPHEDTPTETPTIDNSQDDSTKVENKTPIQYEGQQPTDEDPASDERFRIPEENSSV